MLTSHPPHLHLVFASLFLLYSFIPVGVFNPFVPRGFCDVKNGISKMQSLQSNHAKELKMRESLEASCITLRRENENMAKRYMESLNNLDDQVLEVMPWTQFSCLSRAGGTIRMK
ncbi:hypothetical protein AHAS_Ahas02G0170000 [Arachis hypogaea]